MEIKWHERQWSCAVMEAWLLPHSVCEVYRRGGGQLNFWELHTGRFRDVTCLLPACSSWAFATVINVSCYTTYRDHTSMLLSHAAKVWTSQSSDGESAGGADSVKAKSVQHNVTYAMLCNIYINSIYIFTVLLQLKKSFYLYIMLTLRSMSAWNNNYKKYI